MPGVLIGLGLAMIMMTIMLAFTVYGEMAAVLGIACIVTGAVLFDRRRGKRDAQRPRADADHHQ